MNILRLLRSQVTSERFELRLLQAICYIAAVTVLVLDILHVTSMGLTEFQLLIGVLAILQFSLTIGIVGGIAEFAAKRSNTG